MNANDVVWEITQRSWRFGVAVLLSPTEFVDGDGLQLGGYFCSETKRLAVACRRKEDSWLGVLLHEYCHLTQWVEDMPEWRGYRSDMWTWLAGKRVRNPRDAVKSVQSLEADCERRTMRLARELQAPIDLDAYARSANAYIHLHNVIADERKWLRRGVIMQEIPSLLAAANPTLDTDFSKTPKALRRELEALL